MMSSEELKRTTRRIVRNVGWIVLEMAITCVAVGVIAGIAALAWLSGL